MSFSELFAPGKDTLLVYSFMYGPEMGRACPSCKSILDSPRNRRILQAKRSRRVLSLVSTLSGVAPSGMHLSYNDDHPKDPGRVSVKASASRIIGLTGPAELQA